MTALMASSCRNDVLQHHDTKTTASSHAMQGREVQGELWPSSYLKFGILTLSKLACRY